MLRFLAKLRLTGMPIRKVREYCDLMREGDHTMEKRRDMLVDHRTEVQRQIESLQGNLEILNLKIGLYEQGWKHGVSPANDCSEKLRCLLEENK